MAKYVFGIDLGTTNSCISYIDESGRPAVIRNNEGDETTPSVVNFADPSEVIVGKIAKENSVLDPGNTVEFVKRKMGKTDYAITFNGEDKTPEEVSSYILRKLAGDASRVLGAAVEDVVITCPEYFGTAERVATTRAGEIAGLNVLAVISEPVAAAIYYGVKEILDERTILVFDLGGGTFDVTVMRIGPGKLRVICADGAHSLGGKNWDDIMCRHLASKFSELAGGDAEFDDEASQDLRLRAEQAKWQLTSRNQTSAIVQAGGVRQKIEVTREEFDELTQSLLLEALEKTDAAITVAEEKGYKIDEILLVGGSTRMPQVTRVLQEKYGLEPKVHEPDLAVSKGAAIFATDEYYQRIVDPNRTDEDTASGQTRELENEPPRVTDVTGTRENINIVVATTKSYAVAIRKDGELVCNNLIYKNESMENGSIIASKVFYTIEDNQQAVALKVYETDFADEYFGVDEDFYLGKVVLELSGNLSKGAPIEHILSLSTEGILSVTGKDLTENLEITATMEAKGIMSVEKMEQIRKRSMDVTVS